jgi:hypothetical protein
MAASRARLVGFALSMTMASLHVGISRAAEPVEFIQQYQKTYKDQFVQLKPAVVPLSRGSVNYQVGDIWDASLTRLLESNERCFPGLKPRSKPDTIGTITLQKEQSLSLLLRLKRLFDFFAAESDTTVISVSFLDVIEESPIEEELRRLHKASACPLATPILKHDVARLDIDVPVIIGRLYRGKRRILMTYGSKLQAEAKLAELGALLTGVPVELEAGAKFGSDTSIAIIDRQSVPLAFAPAFIPVLSTFLGGEPNREARYVWTSYNPETLPSQKDLLADLANGLDKRWSWDDQ